MTLAGLGVALLMIHTIANVVARMSGHPMEGALEYSSHWWMPLIAFMGFAAAELRGEHVQVGLVFDRMPTKNRQEYVVVVRILTIVFSMILAWFTLQEALSDMEMRKASPSTGIPYWPTSFLVPLGYLLLAFATLIAIPRDLRAQRERDGEADINKAEGVV